MIALERCRAGPVTNCSEAHHQQIQSSARPAVVCTGCSATDSVLLLLHPDGCSLPLAAAATAAAAAAAAAGAAAPV